MRIRPTRRAFGLAGGALALFAVGTNVQAGWVLSIAALLGGILVTGLFLPLRGLHGVKVKREAPPSATAGDPVPVDLDVSNTGRRLRGLIRVDDEFCGRGSAVISALRPGESRVFRGKRDGCRRGVHISGPCELRTGAPFGALVVRRRLDIPSTIVVYPRVFDTALDAMFSAEGSAPSPIGDVSSIRDYRPGDPLRHVHWRSVARRGELVVREFEGADRGELAIVADAPADAQIADAIASIACSLALRGLRDGYDVRLFSAVGERVIAVKGDSREDILDWGARLAPARLPFRDVVATAAARPAIICVLEPAPRNANALDELRRMSSTTSLEIVLVSRAGTADGFTDVGAKVRSLSTEQIEEWSGLVAS